MAEGSSLPVGLKELEPKGYIGIDFGTAFSHFAYCGVGTRQAQPVAGGATPSEETCVLWRQPTTPGREEEFVTYGSMALQHYGGLEGAEQKRHRLAASFKPHLVDSEVARKDAYAFLKAAHTRMISSGQVPGAGGQDGVPVVIGVPAELGEEHERATMDIAERAGFGRVSCVPEPLGALAHHLASGDLQPEDSRAGVLVVDFGGGTLDVTLVDHKGVRNPWGDSTLGGRLFDDLFYQWLRDQNPNLKVMSWEWVFVWSYVCRKLKENFSQHWALVGRDKAFRTAVLIGDRAAFLKGASVEEFEQRARQYRASAELLTHFAQLGYNLGRLGSGEPVDLFAWIRETLAVGLRGGAFSRVVLAGGSDGWPFMKSLAAEVFGLSEDRVFRSRDPKQTVGSGLAVYHVLKRDLEKTRHTLRGYKAQRKQKFEEELRIRIERFIEQVPRSVCDPLMEEVEPLFLTWHNEGGSLRAVEREVQVRCEAFETRLEGLIRREVDRLSADILRLMRSHLGQWLAEHKIDRSVDNFIADLGALRDGPELGVPDDLTGGLAVAIAASIAALVMGIVVAVKLTVLAAMPLLLLGPIGIVVAIIAVVLGRQAAEDFVKDHNWGSWPLRADLRGMWVVLSEASLRSKLRQNRERAEQQLREGIRKETEKVQRQAASKFEEVMDLVIADLGLLDQLSRPGK